MDTQVVDVARGRDNEVTPHVVEGECVQSTNEIAEVVDGQADEMLDYLLNDVADDVNEEDD